MAFTPTDIVEQTYTSSGTRLCLKWNNHQPNFISTFTTLLNTGVLLDVTLAAEGRQLQAHKLVLCACSPFFYDLIVSNPSSHPVIILKDVTYMELVTLVNFMYYGEVVVSQELFPKLLETAKYLNIKGLTHVGDCMTTEIDTMPEPPPKRNGVNIGEASSPPDRDANTMNDIDRVRKPASTTESDESLPLFLQYASDTPCPPDILPQDSNIPKDDPDRVRKAASSAESSHESDESLPPLFLQYTPETPCPPGSNISADGSYISDSQKEPVRKSAPTMGSARELNDSLPLFSTWSLTPQTMPVNPNAGGNQDAHKRKPEARPKLPEVNIGDTPSSHISFEDSDISENEPESLRDPASTLESARFPPLPRFLHETMPVNRKNFANGNQGALKRKRSYNPQAAENFQKALEAVRVGGIGFCKAARIYGVNNRTLWLEYRKLGYPVHRKSIRGKKAEASNGENINISEFMWLLR